MIKLIVPGKPIAKKRPRFARRGKLVTTYNDQGTEEGRFLFEVQKQWGGQKPLDGPLWLACVFHMPIPKSTSKKRHKLMVDGEIKHTKKPDLDNLVKFVKDCLNGEVWVDDSQIIHLVAVKQYSGQPQTEIIIFDDCSGEYTWRIPDDSKS